MKNKVLWIVFSLLMVAALSACASGEVGKPATRTISVNGNGQVYITPDVAYITIGVQTQAPQVTDALNQNNAQAQAISNALQALGVDAKDIQTSAFNIYPQQNYTPEGMPMEIVYMVQNSVYITVRDLSQLGVILDGVVRAGANNVNSISFDVLDKSAAISEARAKAIADARKTAEEMAAAAGVTLGELQSLNVYSTGGASPVYDYKGAGAREGGVVPIATGQLLIAVDASLVYEIK